ncbi:MAG: hypothetical protein H7231_01300, partial [Rhodoferax sp.]|nr:hypothetical protein [Actinomycetota bacterium]
KKRHRTPPTSSGRTGVGVAEFSNFLNARPPLTLASDGPPPPRAWAERDPDAAARLATARESITALSSSLEVPPENLMTPDVVRRVLWTPPDPADLGAVLAAYGARPWQVELVGPLLRQALSETAATRAARVSAARAAAAPTEVTVDVAPQVTDQ